jgi:hypothetical protein
MVTSLLSIQIRKEKVHGSTHQSMCTLYIKVLPFALDILFFP